MGRSREVVLDRGYGGRRRSFPSWMGWLGFGLVAGALGIVWVQEHLGAPRLTVEESRRIQTERDEALKQRAQIETRERESLQALQSRLDASAADLTQVRQELDQRKKDSATVDETIAALRREVAMFADLMPADPRDNRIGVRAARIERNRSAGALDYHVLLARDTGSDKPFDGIMQLTVTGQRASGGTETVTLPPVPVRVGAWQHLKGSQALPKGFDPRQTSIHVLDRVAGNPYGLRVINVQ